MKKPIRLPYSSFINGINIDKSFCDNVINHFKSNTHKAIQGHINNNNKDIIDKSYKESLDLDFIDDSLCIAFNPHLIKAIKEYEKKYKVVSELAAYSIIENPRIQYYKKGWGFKKWHCEDSGNRRRCLAWMTYLNNVEDGGTEFKHQKLTTPAKKGLTLFWPSPWTHTHRGQISQTKEKYIVTGWYNYAD